MVVAADVAAVDGGDGSDDSDGGGDDGGGNGVSSFESLSLRFRSSLPATSSLFLSAMATSFRSSFSSRD